MARFGSLLLALDLGSESLALIDRVLTMYPEEVPGLHVVHVIKRGLYDSPDLNNGAGQQVDRQRLFDHAQHQIRDLLLKRGLVVPADHIHLLQGEPAFEIKRLAAELNVDLVIVGSHTKDSDWLQLPGATTNCVIQGISSDVMAVKV